MESQLNSDPITKAVKPDFKRPNMQPEEEKNQLLEFGLKKVQEKSMLMA